MRTELCAHYDAGFQVIYCISKDWFVPRWLSGKESAGRRHRRPGLDPWIEEDSLEEEQGTHSSILAWKIPWTEELGGLQSIGLQRVAHDWVHSCTHTHTHTHTHVCTHICVHTHMHTHTCVHTHTHTCSVCVYIYIQKMHCCFFICIQAV